MLGVGWTEMLVIGVVALIVIGPKELPALMQKLGRFAGTVRRMGLTSLVVETAQGDEAIIPYGRISSETLLRTAARDRFAHHTFVVRAPGTMLTSLARARIREAALRSHWAAINREPEIKHTADNAFEVTVFALHPDRVLDIERTVAAALGDEADRAPRKQRPAHLG